MSNVIQDMQRAFYGVTGAIGRGVYDATTKVVSHAMALRSPADAHDYSLNRQKYLEGQRQIREYVSGKLDGPDGGWMPRNTAENTMIMQGSDIMVGRAKDLLRNNIQVISAVRKVVDNVVRQGFAPRFLFRDNSQKLLTPINERYEELYEIWAEKSDNTGHGDIGEQTGLVLAHQWKDRGCLMHRIWKDPSKLSKHEIPMKIALYEVDQLDKVVQGRLDNGNVAVGGIEYDMDGVEVAYHVLESHPDNSIFTSFSPKSHRITTNDMHYIYRRESITQNFGVPWLQSLIMEAFALDEFRDAARVGARLEQNMVAFVHHKAFGPPTFPGGQVKVGPQGATGDSDKPDNEFPRKIKAGMMVDVGDKEIKTQSITRPGDYYADFVKNSLQAEAGLLGLPYFELAQDSQNTSYAYSRQALNSAKVGFRQQQGMLVRQWNKPATRWFFEASILSGNAPVGDIFEYSENRVLYDRCVQYSLPGWDTIDAKNDAVAASTRIGNITDSRHRVCSDRGYKFSDIVDEQMSEEEAMLELVKLQLERKAAQKELESADTV